MANDGLDLNLTENLCWKVNKMVHEKVPSTKDLLTVIQES